MAVIPADIQHEHLTEHKNLKPYQDISIKIHLTCINHRANV